MGSGNDRDRQKRLQRKRAKRAAKRATRQSSGAFGGMSNFADNPFGYPDSPDDLAALTCIQVCTVLFAECRILDDDLRREILDAVLHLGGVWLRLPFELEAFLCKEAPWSLTCADLEPLRRIFAKHGAQVVFGRLWTLALTNEPDAVTRLAAAKHPDCAHRAALG